jgi:hypothetical protein
MAGNQHYPAWGPVAAAERDASVTVDAERDASVTFGAA